MLLIDLQHLISYLLGQHCWLNVYKRHFAHRQNVIANICLDVGKASLAQQANRMPTILIQFDGPRRI